MKKPAILAVDDTPGNLVALEAVLDSDFDLVPAESGTKAIEILKHRSDIAVILMDIQMPIMDGYEAAQRIKKLPGCQDIPIVFITAVFHEDPYVKRGYEVGGVDYFTKPFDPELLRFKMGIYSAFRQRAAVLRVREQHVRETEELLAAGRKLSAVLESLPVGILIADIDGRICQTNDEVARICNASRATDSGGYGEMIRWWTSGGGAFKGCDGPLARALDAGTSSHNEKLDISCADGSSKQVLVSASPLLGIAGEILGAVIVIKDTTATQQIERELETRVARLVSLGVEIEQSLHP
ncbi:MAG TPA: response regulator [Kofleriaceae bacterium]|jgi:CheY-like chemotaxis protein